MTPDRKNAAALKVLPKRLQLRKLTGGRQLRLVGYDPGYDGGERWQDRRQAWATIDIEDPRTGARLGRLHYRHDGSMSFGSGSGCCEIDGYGISVATSMAKCAMEWQQVKHDRPGQPKNKPAKEPPCSYPCIEPGVLVRARLDEFSDGTKHVLASSKTYTNALHEKGWELGVLAATLDSIIDPDADEPFPRVLVVTPTGIRELPADWLDEVR